MNRKQQIASLEQKRKDMDEMLYSTVNQLHTLQQQCEDAQREMSDLLDKCEKRNLLCKEMNGLLTCV